MVSGFGGLFNLAGTGLLFPLAPASYLSGNDFDRFVERLNLLANLLALRDADPMVLCEVTGEWVHNPAGKIIRLQRTRTLLGVVCF